MLDCLDAVVDDIRVFHRIDEPLELPSPRFFGMARWLRVRGGAVTAVLLPSQPDAPREVITPPARSPQTQADVDNSADIAAMAAMSQPGFPGIGYSGG